MVEIEYENVINTSHVLFFRHGDVNPPSFKCIHHGSPDTSITWQVCVCERERERERESDVCTSFNLLRSQEGLLYQEEQSLKMATHSHGHTD